MDNEFGKEEDTNMDITMESYSHGEATTSANPDAGVILETPHAETISGNFDADLKCEDPNTETLAGFSDAGRKLGNPNTETLMGFLDAGLESENPSTDTLVRNPAAWATLESPYAGTISANPEAGPMLVSLDVMTISGNLEAGPMPVSPYIETLPVNLDGGTVIETPEGGIFFQDPVVGTTSTNSNAVTLSANLIGEVPPVLMGEHPTSLETSLRDGAALGGSQTDAETLLENPIVEVRPLHMGENPTCLDTSLRDGAALRTSQTDNPIGEVRPVLLGENPASLDTGLRDGADLGASQTDAVTLSENLVTPVFRGENTTSLDTSIRDGAAIGASQKTELEREMELFEAAEREEEARLLTSLRSDQSGELSPSRQNQHPMEDTQGDRKRALETTLPERRSKRGRKALVTQARKEEEDVCFVCFDGGNLILCDRRSCPKAYHIECTGRESDFFQKKGQWLCGWHVCAHCTRAATIHCYTCPNAFCNTCVREADFLCIRKDRGLCEVCYPIVNMIEQNETINADGVKVDFDDQETYECLFKEYWEALKQKLSLTSAELDKAHKAKEAGELLPENGCNDAERVSEDDDGSSTDSDGKPTTRLRRPLKRKRLTRTSIVEDENESDYDGEGDEDEENESKLKRGRMKAREFDGWASKELLDFIQSRKEDPKKPLTRLAVNKLLWAYIESYKLLNPRRRGQIICDERLQRLFGKKSVGRFEMMKLLSSHIAPKQTTPAKSQDFQAGDDDVIELDNSDDSRLGKVTFEKQRKSRRKSDENKLVKPDPDEYAAINVKNINLIYLKRSLLDDLRDSPEFESKVVGAFVRIRVPGMVNKSDTCYRLVQVVGIKQVFDSENPERRTTDVILEILNLRKREELTVDLVSSQDFTEEECQRLRQSVKYGFIKAMTVGELEEKAKALQEVKVKDWFETELLRLSHLRDRASEKGHKRELRECVEKLQLLSSPEERERKLNAPLEINADPHMDPSYESDIEEMPAKDNQGNAADTLSPWEKGQGTKVWEKNNSVGAMDKHSNQWGNGSLAEANANSGSWDGKVKASSWGEKEFGKDRDVSHFDDKQFHGWNHQAYTVNDKINNSSNEREFERGWGDDLGSMERNTGWNSQGGFGRKDGGWGDDLGSTERNTGWTSQGGFGRKDGAMDKGIDKGNDTYRVDARSAYNRVEGSGMAPLFDPNSTDWRGKKDQTAGTFPSALPSTGFSAGVAGISSAQAAVDTEKEKIWHYEDPTKTIQGPFSMEQLRKWEKTKLFPVDLRIWRTTERQDESILLTDALVGKFLKNVMSGSLQGPNGDGYSQMGWGSAAPGRDLRSASMTSRPGSDWQEKGGRAGWDQDGFANTSTRNDSNAWGASWTAEKRAEDDSWGTKPESAWGSHVPAENSRAVDEGWESVKDRKAVGWDQTGLATDAGSQGKGPFRGNWGREANYRGPDQYRYDKPGNEARNPRKKEVPCRFFARGMCKKGQGCEFKH